jgi:hypothetical protein
MLQKLLKSTLPIKPNHRHRGAENHGLIKDNQVAELKLNEPVYRGLIGL